MTSYKELLDETQEYSLKVKQYAKLQIDQRIWDSITSNDLDNWLSNFKNTEEQLLSAILLESLISRSEAQTTSILTSALQCSLPNAKYNTPEEIFEGVDYIKQLTSRQVIDSIRIVPVIRDLDPPTKSGPSIARMYKRQLGVNEKYMIWPWLIKDSISKGTNSFVFIDDVLASGQQASEFFTAYELHKYQEVHFSYIPLLAHEEGINRLKRDHPYINISPVERIGHDNSLFKNERFSSVTDLEELYLKVAKKYINRRLFNQMPTGYNSLALTFSYHHATPNASLPLYWYESEKFYPLVRR